MASETQKRLVFGVSFVGNFLSASVYSLQSPFFPKEAELKNVSATEYSLVFSVYELAVMLLSPFSGAIIGSVGPRLGVNGGLFICACSCILFGSLTMMPSRTEFLAFAFLIRIAEAAGQVTYFIAGNTLLTTMFPESTNSKLAIVEAAYAGGLMAGPAIGGALYSIGGFMLPFLSTGVLIMVCLFCAIIAVPSTRSQSNQTRDKSAIIHLLKNPFIWVGIFGIFTSLFSSGFLLSTLEPHIRSVVSSPAYIGLIFMISPLIYILTSGLTGYLTDRGCNPLLLFLVGCLCRITAFVFLGPFPWLPLDLNIDLIVFGQLFNGLAYSFTFTAGFSQLFKTAREMGLPKDDHCNAAICAIWQLSISLGIGSGPFVGGVFLDLIGFRLGSLFVIALNVVAVAVCSALLLCARRKL